MNKPIYVTQPTLPPLEELQPYLEQIWERRVLTNCGPLHQELEQSLEAFLGVENVVLCNNGTNALITAIQSLNLTGEVITTPYSFIATCHSLVWNSLTPVFVDIAPDSPNINAGLIEAAITKNTTAILAVHCYGLPCDVAEIERIAHKHNLKVIYDAAHAFNVKDNKGKSLLCYGDVSILSFHATKVFNTFEGGAIICKDKNLADYIRKLRNFGIENEASIPFIGSNAKMSEFNAALGLTQLVHVGHAIKRRKAASHYYDQSLACIPSLVCLNKAASTKHHNYSYYPILFTDNISTMRDIIYNKLREYEVFSRKYFFPLISNTEQYKALPTALWDNLPVANSVADRILCLPLSEHITIEEIDFISKIIIDELSICQESLI